jgi:DNA damage-inducible protein 1
LFFVLPQTNLSAAQIQLQHSGSNLPHGTLPASIQQDDIIVIQNRSSPPNHSISAPVPEIGLSAQEKLQQQMIEERIRLQNVAQNMELALEHNPEAFGQVVMLHIDVVINGNLVKAFVDTGAQTTIMSRIAAEKTGVLRLLDRRFAGVAQGVGSAPIYGRIHMAEIQIGQSIFTTSISVLDNVGDTHFILGLDLLRKYAASVDLAANVLRIGTEQAPFLPEAEIYDEIVPVSVIDPSYPANLAIRQSTEESKTIINDVSMQDDDGSYPEEDIVRLESLGFERQAVLKALVDSDGNIESAASRLIFGRGSIPSVAKVGSKPVSF